MPSNEIEARHTEVTHLAGEAHVTKQELISYSAPLPPASEFERYEKVLPGSANRIILLAERQSGHRRFIEKIVVIFDALRGLAGLLGGLFIVAGGMIAGVYLLMHDKQIGGFVALLVPLGTVAGAFIYQQKHKKDDKND